MTDRCGGTSRHFLGVRVFQAPTAKLGSLIAGASYSPGSAATVARSPRGRAMNDMWIEADGAEAAPGRRPAGQDTAGAQSPGMEALSAADYCHLAEECFFLAPRAAFLVGHVLSARPARVPPSRRAPSPGRPGATRRIRRLRRSAANKRHPRFISSVEVTTERPPDISERRQYRSKHLRAPGGVLTPVTAIRRWSRKIRRPRHSWSKPATTICDAPK
jgi:hypothetical protein